MLSLRSALACAAIFLAFDAALAQAPDIAETTALHGASSSALRDALHALWQDSPQIRAARAELEAARARERAAQQPLYNPTLSLDAENADVDRRSVSIGLTLDVSGKRRARAAEGAAVLLAGESAFEIARRDLAARWLRAWTATIIAQRQAQLGQHRLELMQRFDTLAAQRLTVGDISAPERDLAALALGEAQAAQATLLGDAASARATLRSLGDVPGDALPPLPAALPPPSHEFAARAAEELPDLQLATAQVQRSDAAATVARRNRIPDPTISLMGGQVRSGPLNDRIADRVVGLSISIPLPLLNSGSAEIDAARAEGDAAAAEMESRRLVLRAAQNESRERYDALREAADAFRSGRAAAFEDRTALLEKLWRAGEIGTSDYLVQLKQSLDTALSGLELENRLWQAWFDYLHATGRLVDWIDGHSLEASR
ncbi:MAG: TolC family protein [Proteobacteria bacterium]|nr:TolC family protein [Pseudomonadota bacterium]